VLSEEESFSPHTVLSSVEETGIFKGKGTLLNTKEKPMKNGEKNVFKRTKHTDTHKHSHIHTDSFLLDPGKALL
jgi:hypothetical protein